MPEIVRRDALRAFMSLPLTLATRPVAAAISVASSDVTTADGVVRGTIREGIRIFTGIPFGRADRFKPPRAQGLPAWPRFDGARRLTMILDHAPRISADPDQAERLLWIPCPRRPAARSCGG